MKKYSFLQHINGIKAHRIQTSQLVNNSGRQPTDAAACKAAQREEKSTKSAYSAERIDRSSADKHDSSDRSSVENNPGTRLFEV
jgi:hypothetical protein